MSELSPAHLVALLGFAIGGVFGFTAERANFCTMGGISDLVNMGDGRRLRSWLLAIAVAIAGSQALAHLGLVDYGKSIYLGASWPWFAALLGGALFGFGMTVAGGCGARNLVRIGGGNLKSLVVFLIVGIVAYATLRGILAPARLALEGATNLDLAKAGGQGLIGLLASTSGMAAASARLGLAGIVVLGLAYYVFKDARFRASQRDLVAGFVLGATVVAGWAATGIAGADEFAAQPVPLASLTFVGPIGDSVIYLMTFTGATIGFAVASVAGVIVGSFLSAKQRGRFRIESFADKDDLVRNLVGAVLMGVGGVLAGGCTIGQGLTGISTLSLGSVAAMAGIFGGSVLALKYLEEGTLSAALRAVFSRG